MVTGHGGENAALAAAPDGRLECHLSCISGSDGCAHVVEEGRGTQTAGLASLPAATVAQRRQSHRRGDAVNGAERGALDMPGARSKAEELAVFVSL